MNPSFESYQVEECHIRIYHEFVDWIDNSVPMVTAWHHEALPSDAKR